MTWECCDEKYDTSGCAKLAATELKGSKLRGLNRYSVDIPPLAHPGKRLEVKLSIV